MTRPPQGVARVTRHRRKRTPPNSQKRKKAARVRKPQRSESKISKVGQLTQELREALQQQAATSEILHIISGSPSDVSVVFQKLLAHAARICEAKFGNIYRLEDDALCLVASHNTPAALAATRTRVAINPNFPFGRMAATRKAVHVADIRTEEGYVKLRDPQLVGPAEISGVRTILAVPMLKDGELIGSFTIYRQQVRPFTERQIALVTNFAAQAVVAIENVRLLNELRQRTDELGRSVAELQRERNNKLMNMEAMAAAISHEVRQPLASIAANGSAALRFLGHEPPNLEEVRSALNRTVNDSHRASEIFDSIRTLFGKADPGHEPIDVNDLVHSVMDALQGEVQAHGIAAGVALPLGLPRIAGHRGQLQEVLINLVRNAIEAMHNDEDSSRVLQVSAERHAGDKVMIAVKDSGPGIDLKRRTNIFDAFVTSKSQGMGLGLAISRMIVQRHSGQLSAAPAHPRGAIFRVVLPLQRRN
jgi:signal transduction histidine kinase